MASEIENITGQCFELVREAMQERAYVETPEARVSVVSGMLTSVIIELPDGSTIDLSQMPGDAVDGTFTKQKPAGHDSELEVVKIQEQFPRTERDIELLLSISQTL